MQNKDVGYYCADHRASQKRGSNGTCPGKEIQKSADDFDPAREVAEPLPEADPVEDFHPLIVQGWKFILAEHEEENRYPSTQHPTAEIRLARHKPPIAEMAYSL